MSEYANIQSKAEFCISLFPQEFIVNIIDKESSNNTYIGFLIEGISKASNVFFDILDKYWNKDYESIFLLSHIKLVMSTDISITAKEYNSLIETCKRDLELIDVELIHSVRKELKIVEFRDKISELIERLSNISNEKDSEDETLSFEEDTINTLYEYFIACQYYRNILKIRSRYHKFRVILDKQAEMINFMINAKEESILRALEMYMDVFISSVSDNFMIDPKYKNFNNESISEYIRLFRSDIKTRDVKDFTFMKLLFTVFNSDSMKPFIWFDSRFNKELKYDGTIKSLDECISETIKIISEIDND